MAYADQEMSGSRIVAIIIVALIHVVLGYTLITGLAYSAINKVIERVTTVDVKEPEPEEEPPPPPEEVVTAPPPPVAPPPPISISPSPPEIRTQPNIPPPAPPARLVPPPAPAAPPAPPPPAAPSQARPARPENLSRWSARIQEAYPARAIRQELEGSVGVTVVTGPDGRAQSCAVSRSSGESILDEAACEGMTRYARFEPALNDAGQPTTGRYSTTITYELGN